MKISNLATMLIIIILPISLVLSTYVKNQMDSIDLQMEYRKNLINATHDAMIAYELNGSAADVATGQSQKQNVLACINTFFTAFANNMGNSGADKSFYKPYVPAILFTSYDGYYIYSPIKTDKIVDIEPNTTTIDGKINPKAGQAILDGNNEPSLIDAEGDEKYNYLLKPYIYYTAEYKKDNDYDIIINYSLDNYIAVYGKIGDEIVTKSGYLADYNKIEIDDTSKFYVKGWEIKSGYGPNGNQNDFTKRSDGVDKYCVISYSGDNITEIESMINEAEYTTGKFGSKFTRTTTNNETYTYSQYNDNGKNYALDYDTTNENNIIRQTLDYNPNAIAITVDNVTIEDRDAKEYYLKSYFFSKWIDENLGPIVKASDYINTYEEKDTKNSYNKMNDEKILDVGEDNNPEYETSPFNQHKRLVIQNSIHYNLNSAISTYDEIYKGTTSFELPVMNEEEWDKILNNISMTVFLQGLPCGTKYFNDYSIVTSTNNKDFINANNMFFVNDGEFNNGISAYHKIDCPYLVTNETNDYFADISAEFNYDAKEKKLLRRITDNGQIVYYDFDIDKWYKRNGDGSVSEWNNPGNTAEVKYFLVNGTQYYFKKGDSTVYYNPDLTGSPVDDPTINVPPRDNNTFNVEDTVTIYDHKNVGCYYCIMSSDYEPFIKFDDNGELKLNNEGSDINEFNKRKKAWYTYIAKYRQKVYRTNAYINR